MLALGRYCLWLKREGVRLDGVHLQAYESGGGGLRVRSKGKVAPHSVLVTVPESLFVSLRNLMCDEVAALIEEGGFAATAVLQLAIAAERAKGEASFWSPYFGVVPDAEDLPFLWDEEDLQLLAGSGVDVSARARRARLEGQHASMMTFLAASEEHARSSLAGVTLAAFLSAATLTSSRGFFIDETHGYALVPAADAFNHKCALAPRDGADGGEGGEDGGEGGEEEEEEEEEEQEEEARRDTMETGNPAGVNI